jgi:hypothetical protein
MNEGWKRDRKKERGTKECREGGMYEKEGWRDGGRGGRVAEWQSGRVQKERASE